MAVPTHIKNLQQLLTEYKATVSDRAAEVDPGSCQDWYSLCLGWGIAKGLSPDDAHAFALHVGYDLHDMV